MFKITIYFDTRFHTVNGKQDCISFTVDSVEKVRQTVWNANKLENISDIRVDHKTADGFKSDYVLRLEMYEGKQLVNRIFCFNNGNDFNAEHLETIQDMVDDWETSENRQVVIENNYKWSL